MHVLACYCTNFTNTASTAEDKLAHHGRQLQAEQHNRKLRAFLGAERGTLHRRDVPAEERGAKLFVPPWCPEAAEARVGCSGQLRALRVRLDLHTCTITRTNRLASTGARVDTRVSLPRTALAPVTVGRRCACASASAAQSHVRRTWRRR